MNIKHRNYVLFSITVVVHNDSNGIEHNNNNEQEGKNRLCRLVFVIVVALSFNLSHITYDE